MKTLREEVAVLNKRLLRFGGAPSYKHCCEYSDSLVNEDGQPRFGDLSRLEWMLRVVVGYSRRQQMVIDKLRSDT